MSVTITVSLLRREVMQSGKSMLRFWETHCLHLQLRFFVSKNLPMFQ